MSSIADSFDVVEVIQRCVAMDPPAASERDLRWGDRAADRIRSWVDAFQAQVQFELTLPRPLPDPDPDPDPGPEGVPFEQAVSVDVTVRMPFVPGPVDRVFEPTSYLDELLSDESAWTRR